MPRGGRRPGAGAPKHNFNALKNGKYSDRMRRLGAFLLRHPLLRLIYKRIRANLAKQAISATPRQPAPNGWLAVFVDGKLQSFYLAPKNKKNQSNVVIIIHTKKAAPEKTIIQSPRPDSDSPSRVGKGSGVRSVTQPTNPTNPTNLSPVSAPSAFSAVRRRAPSCLLPLASGFLICLTIAPLLAIILSNAPLIQADRGEA